MEPHIDPRMTITEAIAQYAQWEQYAIALKRHEEGLRKWRACPEYASGAIQPLIIGLRQEIRAIVRGA